MPYESYRHYDKELHPGPGLQLGGASLKWYSLFREDRPIAAETEAEARQFLEGEFAAGSLQLNDEMGFVILHRCGESFYFLLVSSWRNSNELWETVYARDGESFGLFAREGNHKPGYCVWELRAVGHEQQAFRNFLRSARDPAASEAWRADSLRATV